MIQYQIKPKLKAPRGYRILHHSRQLLCAMQDTGDYQMLLAKRFSGIAPRIQHLHDGLITCYLTEYYRTEHHEGGLTGYMVNGFLNMRKIQGYVLVTPEETPARMLLISRRDNQGSIAELRGKALQMARELGMVG